MPFCWEKEARVLFMNFVDQVYKKIVNIEIQGATNIAEAVLNTLKKVSQEKRLKTPRQLISRVKKVGYYLSRARETEPMAENAVRFVSFHLDKNQDLDIKKLRFLIKRGIDSFLFDIMTNKRIIKDHGQNLIKNNYNIFTHCHSSTAVGILEAAKKKRKKFHVFNNETRPLFQGRTTSKELLQMNIKNTQVVDSAGPFFVSQYSKGYDMDLLILGCDAITLDGDAVNKIGSFGLALAAREAKIPVYIATQALKLDIEAAHLRNLKIEQRKAKEIWQRAPQGLEILNYAFDVIPARFILGYITELGIIKPKYIAKRAIKQYKFLNKIYD